MVFPSRRETTLIPQKARLSSGSVRIASIFFSSALAFLEASELAAEASGSSRNTASRWIRAARAGPMTLTRVAGCGQQSTVVRGQVDWRSGGLDDVLRHDPAGCL